MLLLLQGQAIRQRSRLMQSCFYLQSADSKAKGIAFVPRIVTPQTVADDRPGASQLTVPALNRVDIENPDFDMFTWLDFPTLYRPRMMVRPFCELTCVPLPAFTVARNPSLVEPVKVTPPALVCSRRPAPPVRLTRTLRPRCPIVLVRPFPSVSNIFSSAIVLILQSPALVIF